MFHLDALYESMHFLYQTNEIYIFVHFLSEILEIIKTKPKFLLHAAATHHEKKRNDKTCMHGATTLTTKM